MICDGIREDRAPDWQPIETAPRDGTEVLGLYYRPSDGLFGEQTYGPWTMAFDRGAWRPSWDGGWVVEYMSDFGTEYKELDMEPTHWMPWPSFRSGRNLADAHSKNPPEAEHG